MDEVENIPDIKKIQKDLLWGAYEESRTQARHSEDVRSTAINYVLVFTSALIILITLDKKIARDDLRLSLIVVFLGLFAALSSASYVERYSRNRLRANGFRNALDELFFNEKGVHGLSAISESADQQAAMENRPLKWAQKVSGSTHYFWLGIPVLVLVVGIFLTIAALLAP